ncbi:MAG: hypothetical protein ACLQFR_05160 [Streptosporangiaceae bacterium]
MVVVAFVAPYLLDATTLFVEAPAKLPGVELAVVTCEPEDQRRYGGGWRRTGGSTTRSTPGRSPAP